MKINSKAAQRFKIYKGSKVRIREAAMAVLPCVYCTLLFAPLCAVITSIVFGGDSSAPLLWSLLLVAPIGALFFAAEHFKHFWQYILAAAAVIAAVFFVSGNWAAVICLIVVALVKLAGRSEEEHSATIFDEPHMAFIALYPIMFFYGGVVVDPPLQVASVILAVVFVVVNFMYRGLERLNRYIDINENMADFPGRRIGRSGTAVFCAGSLIFLAVVVPLLLFNSTFVPFHIDTSKNSFRVSVPEPQLPEEPEEEKADWMQAIDEQMGEPSPVLEFLGKVAMAAAAVFTVALILFGLYKLSKNFRQTVEEKNDVIEYSRDRAESALPRVKADKLRIFDASPNAFVRKRYMKTVKKGKKAVPEEWHSPAEIENFASVNDQTLHSLYEKARYSSDGCTAEDKTLIQKGQ